MTYLKYHLCISFAGTERDFARKLATELRRRGAEIFFDEFEKEQLWGKFLHDALGTIYYEADYAIVLLSAEYYNRMYPNVERKALLISGKDKILPIRMDDADIPVSLKGIGYLDPSSNSVETIAALTMSRLRRDGLIPSWPQGIDKFYHGTTMQSATDIKENGIQLKKCRLHNEFGPGFYTTRDWSLAVEYANFEARRLEQQSPAVVECAMTFAALKKLEALSFVQATDEYFNFIEKCMIMGGDGHYEVGEFYDMVSGPIPVRPHRMVLANKEQVSFHTLRAVSQLQVQNVHTGKLGARQPTAGRRRASRNTS